MITVLISNGQLDVKARRYETDSFDEAVQMLVEEWMAGEIVWADEEFNAAFSPQWLEANGFPEADVEPEVDVNTEVVTYVWHWCGETDGDDYVVYGYFVKSVPLRKSDWPTKGLSSGISALPDVA